MEIWCLITRMVKCFLKSPENRQNYLCRMVDFLEAFCYNSLNLGQSAHKPRAVEMQSAVTFQGGKP